MSYEFLSDEEVQKEAETLYNSNYRKAIKRSEDPRFWKPNVNNAKKEYKALVRILPRTPNGRGGYSVLQKVHYIKENINGKDVFLTIKCRETLGGDVKCPICNANRALHNSGVPANKEKAKSRSAQSTYISNILILKDITRPEYNEQIKLWEHRKFMNDMIMAPIKEGVNLNPSDELDAVATLTKFTPYNPMTGHNMIVHMNVNPKNNIPSYENSRWEKLPSDLSTNPKLFEYVMSNLIDLSEFVNDVPSEQEILQKFQDFNDRLSQAGSDPGAQAGFVQGGFGSAAIGTGMLHPAAQSVMGAGFGATSAPITVPGFNGSAFQKGDSANYFGESQQVSIDTDSNADDDLPF